MKSLVLLLVASTAASAHVVSMSYGELRLTGRTGAFELRIPVYEIEHVANPETALLNEFHFAGATRTSSECRKDRDDYICHATYSFGRDVTNSIQVECTLYRATVPNHIHMLYAARGENGDQKVFDQTPLQPSFVFIPPPYGNPSPATASPEHKGS